MGFNGNQQSGPITGVNPLTYTGNKPNLILMNRRPTQDDIQQFFLGHWWIVPKDSTFTTGEVWILVSKAEGIATWKRLGGGGTSGLETLTGNTGGVVDPDGSENINIIGSGSVTVTGNPGTNTLTIASSGGGGGIAGINKVYLTNPGIGNYIKPSNLVQVYVECQGGGSGAGFDARAGSGGGYCAKLFSASQLSSSEAYNVGAGGAGGSTGGGGITGSNGIATTFGSFLTANGGTAAVSNNFAVGGTATGGDINIQGGSSIFGSAAGANISGGSSMLGIGGAPNPSMNIAIKGTGYGSGPNNQNTAGQYAAGSDGIIILTEYLA